MSLCHPPCPRSCSEGIKRQAAKSNRKGIQLTKELEETIDRLRRVATCWSVNDRTESYTFDFFLTKATREASELHRVFRRAIG